MVGIPGAACLGIGGTGPGGTVGLGLGVGKGVGWTGIGVLGRTKPGGGIAAASGKGSAKGGDAAAGEELRKAAAEGDQTKLLKLLEEGVNVNQPDEVGYTALQRASCEGQVDIIKQLVRHKANVDHQDDQHGNTALHESAWKGYSRTTELLMRAKANVYVKNKGGFAPLHLACQNGHNQTTRVLLIAGCRPDIKNNYGDTPLHTAGRYGHAGVTRILLSARAGVGETNKNGDTALHIAAAMGRRKLTRILLEAAANQNLKNKQNETARDIARRKEFNQIEEILLNPPPIITAEERLKMELEQKKREEKEARSKKNKRKGKYGMKREKNNDSGASSKDSQSKAKEKKKHKSAHHNRARPIVWSPYGCQYFPQSCQMVDTKIESQSKDQLKDGEKHFVDLAGNVKTGPAGVSNRCHCGPIFKQVEHKLEKDKVAIMDHIDIAHEKLDAKINNLEHRTRGHIQKLSDTVKQKLAAEKEECFQRSERNKINRETEAETHAVQLQDWVEQRLRNHDDLDGQHTQRLRTHKGLLRRKESIREQFTMARSRSEEFLLETQNKDCSDDKPRYGDSNPFDHSKSVYSIPDQDLNTTNLTSVPHNRSYTRIPLLNPLLRCHSADDLLERDTYADNKTNQEYQIKSSDDNNKVWTNSSRNIFSYSTSSETSASNNQQSISSSSHHCSPLPFTEKLDYKETVIHTNNNKTSHDFNSSCIQQNLQSNGEMKSNDKEEILAYPQDNMYIEDKNTIYGTIADQDAINDTQQVNKPNGMTPFSRYDFRNNNPYMHGDLRCQKNAPTFSRNKTQTRYLQSPIKIPRSESCELLPETKESKNLQDFHITQNKQDCPESDIYPDTDRKRIQQAVRRLYDGYIVDGKIDLSSKRLSKDHSSENDLLNDSGYSTRLCNTQGPSPDLADCHGDSEVENLKDGHMDISIQCRTSSRSSLNSMKLDLNQDKRWSKSLYSPTVSRAENFQERPISQQSSNTISIKSPYSPTVSRAENLQERPISQQSSNTMSINSDMYTNNSETYFIESQRPADAFDSNAFSSTDTLRTSSRMSNTFQNDPTDIDMCINDTIRTHSRMSNLSETRTSKPETIAQNTENFHELVNNIFSVKDSQKTKSTKDHYTNNIEQIPDYNRKDSSPYDAEITRDEEQNQREEEKLPKLVGSHFVSGLPQPSSFVKTVRSLHSQLKNTNEIIIIGESSLV